MSVQQRDPNPLVSFIMPIYNYGRYLEESIGSILNLKGVSDFEIIAIDDCSTDNSLDILKSFRDPRLKIVEHKSNEGHVSTVEEGLRLARGNYVARLDPDDRYRPEFLNLTLPKFQKHPEVALVYGDAALMNEGGEITLPSSDNRHEGRDFLGNEFVALLKENFICCPTVIARREAWLETLPLPSYLAFHDDWYLTLSIARRHDFYFIPKVLADYRVHPANNHTKSVRDELEEPSLIRLLDQFFEEREKSPQLEREKQAVRGEVFGAQYLILARKYFGLGMFSEARRCYLRAVRYRARYIFRADVSRQLVGTLIGSRAYARIKEALKSSSEPR